MVQGTWGTTASACFIRGAGMKLRIVVNEVGISGVQRRLFFIWWTRKWFLVHENAVKYLNELKLPPPKKSPYYIEPCVITTTFGPKPGWKLYEYRSYGEDGVDYITHAVCEDKEYILKLKAHLEQK